ncbi:kinesin-like protein KIF23 isoform X2 [Varroa destructor]|uniref:Kinesin motor domain-containing protein n=1 Tax=Varroa destructor TaxID=109461 RepID=A0A7M7M5D5_VARDE|nr:kinesin-like protein KIF23 isoform X2 [Varroa destructor]
MDGIEVYLRLKPVAADETEIVEIHSDRAIIISPYVAARYGAIKKSIKYTFEHVFTVQSSQAEVFDRVAKPCVHDVLSGRPALIFMYGFIGSGKTHTISGIPQNAGILPRALDLLFNSLPSNLKAMKFIFKPDGQNGYNVNTQAGAMLDRQNAMLANKDSITSSLEQTPAKIKHQNEYKEWLNRRKDSTRVRSNIPEYYRVAIFVQYIEIYNDRIYDLLEESCTEVQSQARGPQVLLRGVDMKYAFGATEIEVENADEAIEAWLRGQSRKRMARASMNTESSRSHSVFIVKIVQGPINERSGEVLQEKGNIKSTQLNLVDLVSCKQQKTSGACGDRFRDATNINQSLTVLRKCLEYMRKNQVSPNAHKNIPYSECKLTDLFKNFFEGRGKVKMVACINPRAKDRAQILEVLKFAETAQEIELQRIREPDRIRSYIEPTPAPSLDSAQRVPSCKSNCVPANDSDDSHEDSDYHDDGEVAMAMVMKQLDEAKEWMSTKMVRDEASRIVNECTKEWDDERRQLKAKLTCSEKECKRQAKLIQGQEAEINQLRNEIEDLKQTLIEIESKKECAEKRADRFEETCRKARNEQIRIKNYVESKYARKNELLVAKYNKMVRERINQAMNEGRARGKKDLIMDLLQTDEYKHLDFSGPESPLETVKKEPQKKQPFKEQALNVCTNQTHKNTDCSNSAKSADTISEPDLSDTEGTVTAASPKSASPIYQSESKRVDARWLEHIDATSDPQKDVFLQPHKSRKKSVTKLETKDLKSVEKYALVTAEGSNYQVVRGEVRNLPTGGTSVVFTDVEVLGKEKLGTTGKSKNSESNSDQVGPRVTRKRCGVAIEGHPYMKNVVLRDNHVKFFDTYGQTRL